MSNETSLLMSLLAVPLKLLLIALAAIAAIYFWRKCSLFNQKNQWSSMVSCTLLWAGVAGVLSLILIALNTHFNGLVYAFQNGLIDSFRNGLIGIDQIALLALVPLGAILGVMFGGVFNWLAYKNKASASHLQRSLVGAGVGGMAAIIIPALLTIISSLFNHNPLQEIWQSSYFDLVLIFWGIAVVSVAATSLILGLITPRHLLTTRPTT